MTWASVSYKSIFVLTSGFLKLRMPVWACLNYYMNIHSFRIFNTLISEARTCSFNHSRACEVTKMSFAGSQSVCSCGITVSDVCSCFFNRSRNYMKCLPFPHFLHYSYIKIHSVPDINFIVSAIHFFYFWRTACFLIRNTQESLPLLSVPAILSCRIIYTESLQISLECTRMLLQQALIAMKHIPCLLGDEASIRARHMLVHSAAEGLQSCGLYHLRKRTWLDSTPAPKVFHCKTPA